MIRKTIVLCAGLVLAVSGVANASLIVTGVFDGPLAGGIPKVIELYATADIADLTAFGVGSVNTPGSVSEEFELTGSATAGQSIYIASESSGFTSYFGFAPTLVNGVASINGDDSIVLYQDGSIIDVFGDTSVDGSATAWDYLDGWAYRVDGTGPDGSTFVVANWTFSGIDANDGKTTNVNPNAYPIGSYEPGVVPEPSAAVAALMGLSAIGALSMRARLG